MFTLVGGERRPPSHERFGAFRGSANSDLRTNPIDRPPKIDEIEMPHPIPFSDKGKLGDARTFFVG